MAGKFYAVGLGPGDKGLVTFRAVEVLKAVSLVMVPDSGSQEQVALNLAKEFISESKVITQFMPMSRDLEVVDKQHDQVASLVMTHLDNNQDVAFGVMGDPTIYGSVMYIHKRLQAKGYPTEIIPGVTSFCAAAASLQVPLCERHEALHIIPASYGDIDGALKLDGVKVLMKTGRQFKEVKDKIISGHHRAMAVSRASLEGEGIFQRIEDMGDESSYFTLIVVK